ncbi:MAG: hypothetical protein KJ621_02830, partial [Proteobacteria bacterium]|nr:hypothetical protein [Pseudomonadota bacterium]MBU1740170.1 hypothetical protein [Pseudomonadota bacterium]
DACALAAANKLLAEQSQHDASLTISQAQTIAMQVAAANVAAKKYLDVSVSDVAVGFWNSQTRTFTPIPGATNPDEVNAVRVTVRRDDQTNGPISTFMAGIFNINTVNVRSSAVAYLGFVGQSSKGTIPAPIYIEETALGDPGDKVFQDVETAWSAEGVSFFVVSGDDYMDFKNYVNGQKQMPALKVGDTVYQVHEYSSSWIQSIYTSWLKNRYDQNKDANGVWTVLVPVVGDPPQASKRGFWRRLASWLGTGTAQACQIRWNVPRVIKGYVAVDIIHIETSSSSPYRYSLKFRLSAEQKFFSKTKTGGPEFGSGAKAAIARLVK